MTKNRDPDRFVLATERTSHSNDSLSLQLYRDALSGSPLLTAEDEQWIGKQVTELISQFIQEMCQSYRGLENIQSLFEEHITKIRNKTGSGRLRDLQEQELSQVENISVSLIDALQVMLFEEDKKAGFNNTVQNTASWVIYLAIRRDEIISIYQSHWAKENKSRAYLGQYQQLRNRLVESNLRLVFSVALKFKNTGVALEDLLQEGNIGLLKAVDRFDFNRGFRFSTYAMFCIQNVIRTSLQKNYHFIARPAYLQEKLGVLGNAKRNFEQTHLRKPTVQELSDLTGLKASVINKIQSFPQHPISTSQSDDDDSVAWDNLLADDKSTISQVMNQIDMQAQLQQQLNRLTEKEALVLSLRFGINARKEHSLQEVSEQLGVSIERTRQLQKSGLTKLKDAVEIYPDAAELKLLSSL